MNLNTKEMISKSLISLMKFNDFESITITSITNNANLSRRVFYKHFKNKTEVLLYEINRISNNFYTYISDKSINTPYDYGYYFFSYFKQYSNAIIVLEEQELLHSFVSKIYKNYMLKNLNKVEMMKINKSRYNIVYRFGGLISMLIEWIEQGFDISVEEMASLLALEVVPIDSK